MSAEIIVLMLGAALLHATWNAIIKGGGNPLFETALNAIGGGLGALLCLLFTSLPATESLGFLAGSVSVHVAYYLCIAHAYTYVDLSYGYTIMRGTAPLLTAFVMVGLGQNLSARGWMGVALLSLGVLALTLHAMREGRFHLKGTLIALGTAFVIMGYTVFDGYGARASLNAPAYVCLLFVCNAVPMSLYMLCAHRSAFLGYCKRRGLVGAAGGLCSLLSYGIALWAMTRAPITLVAALRESSVIFGMLLAVVFLKERLTPIRAVAVLMVALGTMAMRLA